jgi:hypothetical protein
MQQQPLLPLPVAVRRWITPVVTPSQSAAAAAVSEEVVGFELLLLLLRI